MKGQTPTPMVEKYPLKTRMTVVFGRKYTIMDCWLLSLFIASLISAQTDVDYSFLYFFGPVITTDGRIVGVADSHFHDPISAFWLGR